jgi:hypothetical protein
MRLQGKGFLLCKEPTPVRTRFAPMRKIEDYRAHAAECRLMANRARSPEDKAMLMNMAATWESLTVDRHRNIARQARIDELEKRAAASIPIDQLNASNDDRRSRGR